MTIRWSELGLRCALGARRMSAPLCLALAVAVASMLGWGWIAAQQRQLDAALHAARDEPQAEVVSLARPAPAPTLDGFYAGLGERGDAERHVGALFALAERHGVALDRGDYKELYDAAARVHLYRIDLPVKGPEGEIWRFCAAAMRAIPFASLDELSFRRESIDDDAVEARLRMTLYLVERDGGRP